MGFLLAVFPQNHLHNICILITPLRAFPPQVIDRPTAIFFFCIILEFPRRKWMSCLCHMVMVWRADGWLSLVLRRSLIRIVSSYRYYCVCVMLLKNRWNGRNRRFVKRRDGFLYTLHQHILRCCIHKQLMTNEEEGKGKINTIMMVFQPAGFLILIFSAFK